MSESSSEGSYSESEIEAFINAFSKSNGRAEICVNDQFFQADMKNDQLIILGLITNPEVKPFTADREIKPLTTEQTKMFDELGFSF